MKEAIQLMVVEDHWFGGYAVVSRRPSALSNAGIRSSRDGSQVVRGCLKSVAEAIAKELNKRG